VPFVVIRFERGAGGFIASLNDGAQEHVEPATLRIGPGDVPYCAVKGGTFEARFSRAAAFQLLGWRTTTSGRGAGRCATAPGATSSGGAREAHGRRARRGAAPRGGRVAWWLTAGAQPATVDEIGDRFRRSARPAAGVRRDGGGRTALSLRRREPDTLAWMPCTCGCASLGHTSNRACYIKAESEGRITFTSHAAT